MTFNDKDWGHGVFLSDRKPLRYLIVKSVHVGSVGTFLFGSVVDYYGGHVCDRWFRVCRSLLLGVDVATSGNSYVGNFPVDKFISDFVCGFPQGLLDWYRVRLSRVYAAPCS